MILSSLPTIGLQLTAARCDAELLRLKPTAGAYLATPGSMTLQDVLDWLRADVSGSSSLSYIP